MEHRLQHHTIAAEWVSVVHFPVPALPAPSLSSLHPKPVNHTKETQHNTVHEYAIHSALYISISSKMTRIYYLISQIYIIQPHFKPFFSKIKWNY